MPLRRSAKAIAGAGSTSKPAAPQPPWWPPADSELGDGPGAE